MFLPLLPNNRTKDFIQNVNETVGLKAGELPSSVCLHERDVGIITNIKIYNTYFRILTS